MKQMPITHRGVVYPWQCDHVGHMNVMWFVGKFDEATWNLFALAGFTGAYLAREHRGLAAVEQHLRYRRELRAGDVLVVRSGVVEVREKVLKFYHEMREALSEEIAATAVLTAVHIDTDRRRACPIPPEIQARAESLRLTEIPPEVIS
ncbi:MAG: thioesterase family protein [Desulfobacterales bacterium]|jgi:acyl-CoA thioester hydrolase|nr:thioesterase family protein [Desulfobacteraceae bacterium]MDY0313122.1 thioesterase family protein [Desulfobacterales bacterium]